MVVRRIHISADLVMPGLLPVQTHRPAPIGLLVGTPLRHEPHVLGVTLVHVLCRRIMLRGKTAVEHGTMATPSEQGRSSADTDVESFVETPACNDLCILGDLCIRVVSLCSVCVQGGGHALF